MIKLKELLTEAFNEVPDISKKDHQKIEKLFSFATKVKTKEKDFMGSIPKQNGKQVPDEMIEKNDRIPNGSVFYDPEYKIMKIKKNGVLIPLSQSSKGE